MMNGSDDQSCREVIGSLETDMKRFQKRTEEMEQWVTQLQKDQDKLESIKQSVYQLQENLLLFQEQQQRHERILQAWSEKFDRLEESFSADWTRLHQAVRGTVKHQRVQHALWAVLILFSGLAAIFFH